MGRWAIALALALVVSGCGDAGDGAGAPATTAPAGTQAPVTTGSPATTAAPEGDCPAAPFTGTISRTVESETGDGIHVVASRSDGELMSAYAYDFGFGGTYTVYVGDHEIDAGGVGSDTLVAPQGGLLATIFLQSETALEAGTVLELGFVPIVDTGGGAVITGFGADELTGAITIIAVEDDRICFDIDTTDPQQRLDGTVSAELVG